MRNLLWLVLCVVFLLTPLSASTIQYQVADEGGGVYRYTYFISGTFLENQEIDIQFDPLLFDSLTNAQPVGGGWDVMAFQPNVPPGEHGDYTAYALIDNPSMAGPFSIDATYSGPADPGTQFFTIQQFDASGLNVISEIDSGWTTPFNADPVPEPNAFLLSAAGLSVLGGWKALRRETRPMTE